MGREQPIIIFNDYTVADATTNIPLFLHAFKEVVVAAHISGSTDTTSTFDMKMQAKYPREDSDWLDMDTASGFSVNASITTLTDSGTTGFFRIPEQDLWSEDMRLVITVGDTAVFTADVGVQAKT